DLPHRAENELLAMEMPFTLAVLQPRPADVVHTYLDKYAKLVPVCELYFSTLYNQDMPTRQRFLSLAHAVEAYHRAFIGGKYMPDEDYERDLKPVFLQGERTSASKIPSGNWHCHKGGLDPHRNASNLR